MKKKTLSMMLAAALCVSMPLGVSAAETAPTSTSVDTTGTVNYVNTTVYSVTLPTAGCFNFVVDPQGILSATDTTGTTYGSELYPDGTAGLIVPQEGNGARINNLSSVPIKLTVEAYVTKDTSDGSASSVNLLEDSEWRMIDSGIDNNMLLTFDITHNDVDVTTFDTASTITTANVNEDVIAITKNGKPDADAKETGTQISFALYEAAYEFKDDGSGNLSYEMVSGEKGDSVGMRLGGLVNRNADWSAYTGTGKEDIIVNTVFSFDKLSCDYGNAAFDDRAHGTLEDVDASYYDGMGYDENDEPTGAPASGVIDYDFGTGAIEIPFNLGSGICELTVESVSVNDNPLASTSYKVFNGAITLKSTDQYVKEAMEAGTPTGEPATVAIKTSDGQTTTITIYMYK